MGIVEEAADAGGPNREFLKLVLQAMRDCWGFFNENKKYWIFHTHPSKLEANEYLFAGIIVGMSLLHGGSGPHFFSPTTTNAIFEVKN